MVREFSAGGVVLRRMSGEWQIAAIEPQKEGSEPAPGKRRVSRKVILALPKGLVDAGEKPDQTAIREVFVTPNGRACESCQWVHSNALQSPDGSILQNMPTR